MIIYVIMFAAIFLVRFINIKANINNNGSLIVPKNRRDIGGLFAACVAIFLVMALRGLNVGIDISGYARDFNYRLKSMSAFDNTEFGYEVFSFFVRDVLHLGFQWQLVFIALIFSLSYYLLFKKYSDNWLLSIVTFMTLGMFTFAMSGLRQTLAISLCNFSIFFIRKRKLIPFVLLVLAAATIHNSAIVFLPVYFLYRFRISKRTGIIIFLVCIAFFFLRKYVNNIIEFFRPERYDKYGLDENYSINPLVILVPLVINVYVLFYLPVGSDGMYSNRDSFFFVFSCLYLLMLILSINNNQIGRLCYYFATGYAISIATACQRHRRIANMEGTLICCTILLLCLAYFFVSTPGGTLQIDNYTFFWD